MSSNAERFGSLVEKRRLELDLNQLEVGAAGGPSNTTLTVIENGRLETLTASTAKKLDKGLGWEQGSARRAWLGGDPVPVGAGSPALEKALAEIEQANISDSTKRYIVEQLKREHATTTREAGETA